MPAAAPAQDTTPGPGATEARHYRQLLHELADLGMDLARIVHREAARAADLAPPAPAAEPAATPGPSIPGLAVAFDRIARTVRRTVALAQRIAEPPTPDDPARHARTVSRTRIIRDVEDAISRVAEGDAADSMRAEFAERLDDPALDDDLAGRPVTDLIAEICHDLGIAARLGTERPYWVRRTPDDVAALRVRAAQPPRPTPRGPAAPHLIRPPAIPVAGFRLESRATSPP